MRARITQSPVGPRKPWPISNILLKTDDSVTFIIVIITYYYSVRELRFAMSIRPAIKDDCAAIAEIYNHAVVHTAAIWNDKTVDTDNRIAWFEARQLAGFPVLVSEENGVITGYSSFGDWRAFDGFRHTVEHSVYVHPDHQGKGLGRKLLVALIAEARRLNKHVMVAGIESQNHASLHLHETLGFITTGQMPQVGTKFGRWLDLTFMQLQLDARQEPDGKA